MERLTSCSSLSLASLLSFLRKAMSLSTRIQTASASRTLNSALEGRNSHPMRHADTCRGPPQDAP
eukprot:7306397-Pyramimonas_sp.AAC.1